MGMTPIPGFPEFVAVGYVDGVQFVVYDSDRRELIPREQWMVESEGLENWKRKTSLAQEQEQYFKAHIPQIMFRTNQSGGIHTYQLMYGCDLRDDGTTSGFNQYGWDGQDFISLDKDNMVWVTPVPWGQITKNSWDRDTFNSQRWKHYLEGECIEWLRKYVEYGQRKLRVVAPVVSFTRLGDSNRLSCAVTGFYPQAIEVNLWRDGVVIDETLSTGILPNHDSTYQIRKWVEFDPEDQAEYSCRVEHSGMKETLVVIYEPKSRSQVAVTVGIVVGVLVLIALIIVAVVIYNKKDFKHKNNPSTITLNSAPQFKITPSKFKKRLYSDRCEFVSGLEIDMFHQLQQSFIVAEKDRRNKLRRSPFFRKEFPPKVSPNMREAAMIGLIELVLLCGEVSAGSHSLQIFVTGMTPIPGFPEFVIVGYVDDLQVVVYDSDRKELIPREQWMVERDGHEAWEQKKILAQELGMIFKVFIPSFISLSQQTGSIHVLQLTTGCNLRDDGTTSAFNQFGWNGQDVLSFDKDHMVWVTPVPWGESIKNKLDRDTANNERCKQLLEVHCIEWLRKFLEFGQNELTAVAPVVSFTRLGDSNRLSCAVTGFYPQPIEVNLWRDVVVIVETLSSGILPNQDSTYQIRKWIAFDPEDQAEYSCRVEHSGMKETLVVIYEPKSRSQVAVTVGIVVWVLVLITLIIVAVVIYNKKEWVEEPQGWDRKGEGLMIKGESLRILGSHVG
ncbi:uncharacterized protein LOC144497682 [Mustelus asterias]